MRLKDYVLIVGTSNSLNPGMKNPVTQSVRDRIHYMKCCFLCSDIAVFNHSDTNITGKTNRERTKSMNATWITINRKIPQIPPLPPLLPLQIIPSGA
jgi:hypothetical protein